jgi:hypothetical protein
MNTLGASTARTQQLCFHIGELLYVPSVHKNKWTSVFKDFKTKAELKMLKARPIDLNLAPQDEPNVDWISKVKR